MRECIRDVDAGRDQVDDAEVDRDAAAAAELEQLLRGVVLQFLAERAPDAGPEVAGTALLRMASIHVMAGLDMGPDDFAELARATAERAADEARQIRKKLREMPRG